MTGQELDVLELGTMPARCLKGENAPKGQEIIRGRAARGLETARRQAFYRDFGKKLPWADLLEPDEERLRREVARLDREKQAAIKSLREYHDRREAERQRLVRRIVAMEKEKGRLKSTIRILLGDD